MSQPCELPPCPPCPPPPPPVCQQVCPPPPPLPPCRPKPVMRGLHWAQTQSIIWQGFVLAFIGGAACYFLFKRPKEFAYQDYYLKADLDEQEDEMARKGLFQGVPPDSLKDHKSEKQKKGK